MDRGDPEERVQPEARMPFRYLQFARLFPLGDDIVPGFHRPAAALVDFPVWREDRDDIVPAPVPRRTKPRKKRGV